MHKAHVQVDLDAARAQVAAQGMFAGMASNVRVDVFVPSIPFYAEAELRRVPTDIFGRTTWVHSAEVLSVFKLLFFRPKDLLDVERMLQIQGPAFNRSFVLKSLTDMLGEHDTRVEKWNAICSRNPAGAEI